MVEKSSTGVAQDGGPPSTTGTRSASGDFIALVSGLSGVFCLFCVDCSDSAGFSGSFSSAGFSATLSSLGFGDSTGG